MATPPIAIALVCCDLVIVDHVTRKVSLVNTFSGLGAPGFPWTASPFCIFAVLTDGQGDRTVTLTVTRLETDEEIVSLDRRLRFPDRFTDVQVLFRLTQCQFPAAGAYQFTLLVDGEWVAQRRLRVYERRSP
jgi:hypothetical protein